MTGVLIKITFSLGVLLCVLAWVGGAYVWQQLSGLSLGWLAIALAALTGATVSMARRWQLVAAHLGLRMSYLACLREYYLGALINQVLPGGVTGDVARALRARHGADLKTAALSVALERLLGQVAILTLLALGLASALLWPGGIAWPQWAWVMPATLLAVGVGAWHLRGEGAGDGAGAGSVTRVMRAAIGLQSRPELILHGVLTTVCLIFSFYACARAAGTSIPPGGWATLIPLILCAMLIPLSIGGWGWREGMAALLFPLIGAAPSAGVATGLAYGSAVLIAALPAVFILLAHGLTTRPSPLQTKGSS